MIVDEREVIETLLAEASGNSVVALSEYPKLLAGAAMLLEMQADVIAALRQSRQEDGDAMRQAGEMIEAQQAELARQQTLVFEGALPPGADLGQIAAMSAKLKEQLLFLAMQCGAMTMDTRADVIKGGKIVRAKLRVVRTEETR